MSDPGEHCTHYKADVAPIIAANNIAVDKGGLRHIHSALSDIKCLIVFRKWISAQKKLGVR